MSTQTFPVTGLTCAHCVGAITSELKAFPGVTAVRIDLVTGGTSTLHITAEDALTDAQVVAALDGAGDYALVAG